jgi:hypothetical protein
MQDLRIHFELIHFALAAVLAGGFAACAADPASGGHGEQQEISGIEQNIISNAKTSDDSIETLGLVQVATNIGLCSGVLIGPHTALTARHCGSDVGTTVSFLGTIFTATQTFEPPSQFDNRWGPRDLEILVLDRDVLIPGTSTSWSPELPVWPYDLPSQVGGKLLCFGAGANENINGSATGNAAFEFYGAVLTIAAVEDDVSYRVVPGLQHGDSGGPCFAPTWWNSSEQYALMSINGTSVIGTNPDGSDTPGSNAALTATGEAGINAWINDNIH